jgi:hypothetical protein
MRTLLIYGVSIIMLALVAQWWFDTVAGPKQVAISDFVETMEAGDFEAVQILERSNEIQAREPGTSSPPTRTGLKGR